MLQDCPIFLSILRLYWLNGVLNKNICTGVGELEVKMVGLKYDLEVMIVPIEEGVFGCTYVPEMPGKVTSVIS